MRIRIAHETQYDYERPAREVLQLLRLQPRDHDGQRVLRWRVEVDAEGRLRRGEDAFGNVLHTFTLGAPVERMTVRVTGEVETRDTAGVIGGWPETLPPSVYLRATPLTALDPAMTAFADTALEDAGPDPLDRLHALMAAIYAGVEFRTGATSAATTAAEAFALKRGVCQDLAHIFIACARRAGSPARYVSGHLLRSDRIDQEAAHAWAEAWIEGLGWLGFDPANGVSPTERHLRIAAGPDYLAAAPVRGARYGGGAERMEVRLRVCDPSAPSQAQSQTAAGLQMQAQAGT